MLSRLQHPSGPAGRQQELRSTRVHAALRHQTPQSSCRGRSDCRPGRRSRLQGTLNQIATINFGVNEGLLQKAAADHDVVIGGAVEEARGGLADMQTPQFATSPDSCACRHSPTTTGRIRAGGHLALRAANSFRNRCDFCAAGSTASGPRKSSFKLSTGVLKDSGFYCRVQTNVYEPAHCTGRRPHCRCPQQHDGGADVGLQEVRDGEECEEADAAQ